MPDAPINVTIAPDAPPINVTLSSLESFTPGPVGPAGPAGGVTSIVAGTNVTLTPSSGIGAVG